LGNVRNSRREVKLDGEDETGVDGWRCSECNFFEPWFYEFDDDIDFIKRYEHCPKCGRRMASYTGKQEGR
jgi:DNA-directed RNA polymerase subunit RPC12/RpoP